jgi:hypothetical protein
MAKAKTPRANPVNNQVLTMPEVGSIVTRKASPMITPSVDMATQIRERAYQLYQERGSAPGHETEDWFKAEREILARQNQLHTA